MEPDMLNTIAAEHAGRRAVLMDSISLVTADNAGDVVVSASHGGVSSAEYALRHHLGGVFFNDAGVGKDRAGIAALEALDRRGVPAAVVSHTSARIGDARDTWDNGRLSHVNAAAARRGLAGGQPVSEAAQRLLLATSGSDLRAAPTPAAR
jgi:hypothetical protein